MTETHDTQISQKNEELQDKLDSFELKYQREKSKYQA